MQDRGILVVAMEHLIGNPMWPIEWHPCQYPRSLLLFETFLTPIPHETEHEFAKVACRAVPLR